jgi:hypothetical protein
MISNTCEICRDYLFGLLKRDYENKIKESKLGGATEHAQPAYREDPNDVIDLTNDKEAMSALENAYFPAMELRSNTEERRKAEVSHLTEEFQKRVRTMEEVFDKAGAPDRPGEVGIIDLFKIVLGFLGRREKSLHLH